MAAGDGLELIGATTLGVLRGVVCKDAMVKWGVRLGVAEKDGRLRADTRGGGGRRSSDGTGLPKNKGGGRGGGGGGGVRNADDRCSEVYYNAKVPSIAVGMA